ncbi:hypothetical protein ILYODFUR_026972 [Ilyodon furcidens]|uniref:Secreted protein n=1 Tax=Ilyodon furcidens TaxID=33524 RepID=A0ABV0U8T2_9TELE
MITLLLLFLSFLLFVFPSPPSIHLRFVRRVMPLEAAEQRNCLLSRVDFSSACKLLCIDTLSEWGRHTGPGRTPPRGHAADLRVLPPVSRGFQEWCEGVIFSLHVQRIVYRNCEKIFMFANRDCHVTLWMLCLTLKTFSKLNVKFIKILLYSENSMLYIFFPALH